MPPIERAYLRQRALLFRKNGQTEFNESTFEYPVEIAVRWVERTTLSTGPDGTPISTDITVIANEEFYADDVLWLGTLEDWIGTGSNDTDSELQEVKTATYTPDIKGRETRRSYGLTRYKGTLQ